MSTEEMTPLNDHDSAFEALHKEIRERAAELGEKRGLPEEVVHQVLDSVTDPGKFSDLVAGYIELSVAEKQGLLETLTKPDLPTPARQEAERELGRLERSGRESMEAQVTRTYLEWAAELPWNTRSDDNLDLSHAQTVLDEDHYGLPDVKDRVLEFLAVRQLRAAQLEEELKQTGEMSIAKLKATKE